MHPELGTLDDFDRLVAARRELGLEIALDFAMQCSPDHPWLEKHPEWFQRRPDGTIKYAENPPKRYQDIVNVDFDSPKAERLWEALLDVVAALDRARRARCSASTTRTRSRSPFWEWLIATVHEDASRRRVPRRGVHAARR